MVLHLVILCFWILREGKTNEMDERSDSTLECPKNTPLRTLYPDPKNCRRYYQCNENRFLYFQCYKGFVFDPCRRKCLLSPQCLPDLREGGCPDEKSFSMKTTPIFLERIWQPVKIRQQNDALPSKLLDTKEIDSGAIYWTSDQPDNRTLTHVKQRHATLMPKTGTEHNAPITTPLPADNRVISPPLTYWFITELTTPAADWSEKPGESTHSKICANQSANDAANPGPLKTLELARSALIKPNSTLIDSALLSVFPNLGANVTSSASSVKMTSSVVSGQSGTDKKFPTTTPAESYVVHAVFQRKNGTQIKTFHNGMLVSFNEVTEKPTRENSTENSHPLTINNTQQETESITVAYTTETIDRNSENSTTEIAQFTTETFNASSIQSTEEFFTNKTSTETQKVENFTGNELATVKNKSVSDFFSKFLSKASQIISEITKPSQETVAKLDQNASTAFAPITTTSDAMQVDNFTHFWNESATFVTMKKNAFSSENATFTSQTTTVGSIKFFENTSLEINDSSNAAVKALAEKFSLGNATLLETAKMKSAFNGNVWPVAGIASDLLLNKSVANSAQNPVTNKTDEAKKLHNSQLWTTTAKLGPLASTSNPDEPAGATPSPNKNASLVSKLLEIAQIDSNLTKKISPIAGIASELASNVNDMKKEHTAVTNGSSSTETLPPVNGSLVGDFVKVALTELAATSNISQIARLASGLVLNMTSEKSEPMMKPVVSVSTAQKFVPVNKTKPVGSQFGSNSTGATGCVERTQNLTEFGDSCDQLICLNGGVYLSLSSGLCGCECQAGFRGMQCQHLFDPMECHCANGGRCVQVDKKTSIFACLCPMGLIGPQCQYRMPHVEQWNETSDTNLTHMPYKRTIRPRATNRRKNTKSMTGLTIDQLVHKHLCVSNQCLNGGLCLQDVKLGEKNCFCTNGYTGELCESCTTCEKNK